LSPVQFFPQCFSLKKQQQIVAVLSRPSFYTARGGVYFNFILPNLGQALKINTNSLPLVSFPNTLPNSVIVSWLSLLVSKRSNICRASFVDKEFTKIPRTISCCCFSRVTEIGYFLKIAFFSIFCSFLDSIFIWAKNFDFWQGFTFLTSISTYDKNFDLWQEFRFLTKISMFTKFWFLTKISILDKNSFLTNFPLNFWHKFIFLIKNSFLDTNFYFWLKFRVFFTTISFFDKKVKIRYTFCFYFYEKFSYPFPASTCIDLFKFLVANCITFLDIVFSLLSRSLWISRLYPV